jgi:cob(I)alamin adenosyltransferase
MSIITKNGDDGKTSLFGGTRVPKHHSRIEAYGTVDEAASAIGMVRASGKIPEELDMVLERIQRELFIVGSDLATPDPEVRVPRVTSVMIEEIEGDVAKLESELPELRSFVMPSGTSAASTCYWTRTVVRRAERHVSALLESGERAETVMVYLNRLGDLLFVMARALNRSAGVEDEGWSGTL